MTDCDLQPVPGGFRCSACGWRYHKMVRRNCPGAGGEARPPYIHPLVPPDHPCQGCSEVRAWATADFLSVRIACWKQLGCTWDEPNATAAVESLEKRVKGELPACEKWRKTE